MATSTFLLFLLAPLLPAAVRAQQRNSTNIVILGSSLSPINATNSSSSWLSPSGRFAFGFYSQSDDAFVVAVWFANIPEKTVVWHFTYENGNNQKQALIVYSNATLILNNEGSLILRDGQGKENYIFGGAATTAAMLESGNFVLYNSRSQVIWQTFDSPTNTILQGQRLLNGVELFSASIASQNLKGRFRLKMQRDAYLVQYPIHTPDTDPYAYWAVTASPESGVTLNLDDSGNLYLLNGMGANKKNITDGWNLPSKEMVQFYRATLDADGIFRVYSRTLDRNGSWMARWSSVKDKCKPKGLCGLNAYCVLMDQMHDCHCIPQFDFTNQEDKSSDCVRKISYESKNNSKNEKETSLTMVLVEGTSWYLDGLYSMLPSTTEDDCTNSCLEDCNCEMVRYDSNNVCGKHGLPLMYGERDGNPTKTFIKINKNNNPENPDIFTKTGEANGVKRPPRKEVIAIGTAFLLSSLAVLVISGVLFYKNYTNRAYKRILPSNSGLTEEISLRAFEYRELEQATNGFKEEVGRGAFGIVFKGMLPNNNQAIAVKRLEKNLVDEASEKEFQTEMRVIGKTHHKNLLKLLGYCQSGSNHRLLVYEYMSKGSLANFLFNSNDLQKPSWEERLQIALNIARGILYLHEECETQIIHCDIKLQNILMDEYGCAKIGDFGLAKLLKPDETKTFTGIRGTRGYVAPEWHRNLPVTVKVDVYSFGIVLLEIVCCRRNVDMSRSEDETILADWVYECFENGNLCKLVRSEDDGQVNINRFDRAVRVALWCIQDEPSLRPSMKKVVLMLEGTIDIPTPPGPSSFFSSI